MIKKLFTIAILIFTLSVSCKKSTKEIIPPVKTEVEIGNQIWTNSNYSINGNDLFSYEDAKKITPIEGYRFPNKEDWEVLFKYLGHKPNTFSKSLFSTNPYISNTFLEGEFDIIKSLLSNDNWGKIGDVTIKGTNETGFNSKPNKSIFFVSDPIFGYCDLFNDGFYMGVYSKDPRSYSNLIPTKFSIRFVKNK